MFDKQKLAHVKSEIARRSYSYLFMYTFNELYHQKIPIIDHTGVMWIGPDRRGLNEPLQMDLWKAWKSDVHWAHFGHNGVADLLPARVLEYYNKFAGAKKPCIQAMNPELEMGMPGRDLAENSVTNPLVFIPGINCIKEAKIQEPPMPFTPPRFTWSYSALSDFETCPFKFAASRYFMTVKYEESEAQAEGNKGHKTAELYLQGKTLGDAPFAIDIVKPYCDALLSAAQGGELFTEYEICLTEKLAPAGWWDKDAWGRGKLDVALIKNAVAKIYDWKFGKEKVDILQLQIFCLFLALVRPDIQQFEARFIWLKQGKISDPVVLQRTELFPVLQDVLARVARMKAAWDSETFQKRTSGLCKQYCGVIECPHCGKGSAR